MDTHLTDTNAPDAGEPVEPTDQELAVCDIGRAFEQTIAKLRAELTDAREELRLYRDFYESAACGAFTGAAEERIQAHRAKTSGSTATPATGESGAGEQASGTTAIVGPELPIQSPSSADSDAPALVQEFATERLEQISADMDGPLRRKPPYETAPTLEKGVRYRVVEASPRVWPWEPGDLPIGREFVAGERDESSLNDWASIEGVLKEPGWYDIQSAQASGWHRVVRVESAPAKLAATLDRIEANQPRGKVTEADGPLFIPEPTDDGPARLVGALHDPIHPASGALIRSQEKHVETPQPESGR